MKSNYFILLGTIWISNIKFCIMIISNKMNILPIIIISYFILLPILSGWWYTSPSEKWWSLSVGMMKFLIIPFPTEWKVIKAMFLKSPTSYHEAPFPSWSVPSSVHLELRAQVPLVRGERRQMWRGFMGLFSQNMRTTAGTRVETVGWCGM